MQGKITASSLNVRKGTSTTYSVVKTLPRDTVVNILGNKKVGTTLWYQIKEGWVSGKYITIMSDTKNEIIVTPSMSMTKIQECLKESGCTIRFAKGIYNITKTLTVYSNTNIIIEKGATLIRKTNSHVFRGYVDPQKNYNYNAVVNVNISGEGTIKNGINKTGSMFGFIHGNNITIKDITIQGVYKSHGFDLPACKNVTIDNVTFKDRIVDTKNIYKEDIQYDYAMKFAYPYYNSNSPVYNDNHCENITVIKCKFYDSPYCIGTHTETNSITNKHKNIQILNCIANGKVVNDNGIFAKIINTDGVKISNNKINGFARGIQINTANSFHDKKGKKYTSPQSGKTGSSNITIEYNTISDAKGKVKAAGIYIYSMFDSILHKNIIIKNNKFRLNNNYAKYDIFSDYAEGVDVGKNDTKLEVVIK